MVLYSRARVAVVATLVLLVASINAGTAEAGGGAPERDDHGKGGGAADAYASGLTSQQWERQSVLEGYSKRLTVAEEASPGFYGVEINAKLNTVTIFSTGTPTGNEVEKHRAAAPDASVIHARALLGRTQVEVLDALVSRTRKGLREEGIKVVQWGMLDGPQSPYVVSYSTGAPTQEMIDRYAVYGPGTVVFRPGKVWSLGRYDDFSPFYGGSNIVASDTSPKFNCTAGFSGLDKSTGTHYVTMADHCVKKSDRRAWISNGTFMGPITAVNPFSIDTALINTTAAGKSSSSWIFDGPYGQNTRYKPVVGVDGFSSGTYVCTSGSYTGSVCNSRMGQQSLFLSENLYDKTESEVHVYSVRRDTYDVQIVDGDSGGPVFTNTNGNTEAIGRGTIAGGIEDVPCPSQFVGHICTRMALVVDLENIASVTGLTFGERF